MDTKTQVFVTKPDDFSPHVEAAGVYLRVKEKILFLQISDKKMERGRWGVPGGKIEPGEEPLAAARRELFEETQIQLIDLKEVGKLFMRKPKVDYVFHLFEGAVDVEPSVILSQEHCQYRWVSREEASSLPLMGGGVEALAYFYKCVE